MKKLGFGFMRLPLINDDFENVDQETLCRMVDHFIAKGFQYFDTAWFYHNGKSETAIKECLVDRYSRTSFLLADKMPLILIRQEEELEEYFETQCSRCGVDYFDYYLIHDMGGDRREKAEKFHVFDFLKQKKAAGLVRQIGFSFRKMFPAVLVFTFLSCGVVLFYAVSVLQTQARHLFRIFSGEQHLSTMEVTELALVLAMVSSGVIFAVEFWVRCPGFLYLLTTALLLLSPLSGIRTNEGTFLLFIIFQGTFLALHTTRRRYKKNFSPLKDSRRISRKSSTIVAIFLAVMFLISLVIAAFNSQRLFDSVYEAEGFVSCVRSLYCLFVCFAAFLFRLSKTAESKNTGTGRLPEIVFKAVRCSGLWRVYARV